MSDRILVIGGAGFIGSHICAALGAVGHTPLILDNFSNADPSVLSRLGKIMGAPPQCIRGDASNRALLERLLRDESISAVIHLSGFKDMSGSMTDPLRCYESNVVDSLTLIASMRAVDVKTLIFSSSAAVYGIPDVCPIPESARCRPRNPYGHAKHMVEQVLKDLCLAEPGWRIMLLRYFNPTGAHESGLIGEPLNGQPCHLLPTICQVVAGLHPFLTVQGSDYPTPDGTSIRDYVHVMDIAQAHALALDHLRQRPGLRTLNLGSGQGHSVLEVVCAMERASGRQIPVKFGARKPGDIPACWADPSLARSTLGWSAHKGLASICEDMLRWVDSELASMHGT